MAKGIAALVTDSGVRDTNDLRALGLPVFSGSVSIKGTVKETLGPINHPLIIGDEIVYPGDLIKVTPTASSWCDRRRPSTSFDDPGSGLTTNKS